MSKPVLFHSDKPSPLGLLSYLRAFFFRYRTRVCRIVAKADGSLIKDRMQTRKSRPMTNPFSLLDLARGAP